MTAAPDCPRCGDLGNPAPGLLGRGMCDPCFATSARALACAVLAEPSPAVATAVFLTGLKALGFDAPAWRSR